MISKKMNLHQNQGTELTHFLRLGREGYTRIQRSCHDIALYLSSELAKLGPFDLLSDGRDLPVFAWKLREETNFSLFDLEDSVY